MSSQQDLTVRVTAKDAGAAKPFQDLAKSAKEAAAAMKGIGKGAGAAGGMFSGAGGRAAGVLQALGLGSFSGIALGGGAAGIAALAGKDLGGAGLNALYNKKYGTGPLQKEDGGMILGQLFGTIDQLTGRKFREQAQDKALEKTRDDAGRREMVAQQSASMGDAFRQMMLNRSLTGNSDEQFKAGLGNIDAQLNPIAARARQAGIQGSSQEAYRNEQFSKFQNSTGKDRAAAMKEMLAAQLELSRLTKQEVQDQTKLAQLLGQQKELRMQSLQATKEGIHDKGAELGGMDKLGRMQATELGGKLKRGEKLSPQELEAASSFGILSGLVRERRIQEADKSGDLASFLKAAGTDAEKKLAIDAEAKNVSIDVQLKLDEQQISAAIARGLSPLNARIEKLTIRVADNEANMKKIDNARGQDKGALLEQ